MKSISLSYLAKYGDLQSGTITLRGVTGIKYNNLALYIPNLGWIPCSKKLQNNFTCDPNKLMLVIEEGDDEECVTSNRWVTISNINRTLGSELIKNK